MSGWEKEGKGQRLSPHSQPCDWDPGCPGMMRCCGSGERRIKARKEVLVGNTKTRCLVAGSASHKSSRIRRSRLDRDRMAACVRLARKTESLSASLSGRLVSGKCHEPAANKWASRGPPSFRPAHVNVLRRLRGSVVRWWWKKVALEEFGFLDFGYYCAFGAWLCRCQALQVRFPQGSLARPAPSHDPLAPSDPHRCSHSREGLAPSAGGCKFQLPTCDRALSKVRLKIRELGWRPRPLPPSCGLSVVPLAALGESSVLWAALVKLWWRGRARAARPHFNAMLFAARKQRNALTRSKSISSLRLRRHQRCTRRSLHAAPPEIDSTVQARPPPYRAIPIACVSSTCFPPFNFHAPDRAFLHSTHLDQCVRGGGQPWACFEDAKPRRRVSALQHPITARTNTRI